MNSVPPVSRQIASTKNTLTTAILYRLTVFPTACCTVRQMIIGDDVNKNSALKGEGRPSFSCAVLAVHFLRCSAFSLLLLL